MNTPIKAIAAGCCLLIIGLFFVIPVAGSQKANIIKIATLAPEGSPWIRTLKTVSDEISKKTNNRCVSKYTRGEYWEMKKTCCAKYTLAKFRAQF